MEYELALKIYKNMLLSRALDEKCKQLLKSNVFVPNFHSGTGQEAKSEAMIAKPLFRPRVQPLIIPLIVVGI